MNFKCSSSTTSSTNQNWFVFYFQFHFNFFFFRCPNTTIEEEHLKNPELWGLMTLTPCGGHTDQGLIPLIGCVSLCGGVMPVFFQKWKNAWSQHQKTHGANINYPEPTNQESNLIKLLVLHPLENLYILSFGFSPQSGLKV